MSVTPDAVASSGSSPDADSATGLESDFEFAMGEFRAVFRGDRSYAGNHMWAQPVAGTSHRWRFGLTAYAVRLLQDVYFLDWLFEPAMPIRYRQTIGSIESKKAESDLYSPAAGVVHRINDEVLEDPSLINAEPYDGGWMFELDVDDADFMTPTRYREHLNQAWVVAQRTIKGQANTEEV